MVGIEILEPSNGQCTLRSLKFKLIMRQKLCFLRRKAQMMESKQQIWALIKLLHKIHDPMYAPQNWFDYKAVVKLRDLFG